ncbi:MAG: class II aldolase/adducin family protein [Bacillota bacterium]
MNIASKLDEFAAASRQVAHYGLTRCSSGNLSYRLDDQRLLIKASRAWMADLTPDDISLCRIADGATLNGKKPSVEIGFHAGVLRHRPDVNVVLHYQSPAATTLGCCRDLANIDFSVIAEIPYYVGPIGLVPYILPGSPALAEAVTQVMKDHDLAILANHGQVTVGKTFADAIQKAAFFELACEVLLRAGPRIQPLSPSSIAELRTLAVGVSKGV